MSKQKLVNDTQITTGAVEEKEVSDIKRCRETISAVYMAQAKQMFVSIACKHIHDNNGNLVSAENVMSVLDNISFDNYGVWVYTQPSDDAHTDGLTEIQKSWNKALPIGQRWFKKGVLAADALVWLRAYGNYVRYKEDSDKALLRSAKKALADMTQEELIAFVLEQQKKAQAQTTDQPQTDNNGK